jgi:hypothetical protein
MALNLTNINYSGKELATEVVREAFKSSLIHTSFGARVLNGIKSDGVWHNTKIDLDIVSGKPVCPNFGSNAILNQNTVKLCNLHISGKIDHDALVGTYRERFLAEGVLTEQTPDDVELFAAITQMIIEGVSEAQGLKFLQADSSYDDCADGLLLQFKDSTLGNRVPNAQLLLGTPAATVSTTVQEELNKVINALPSKFRYKVGVNAETFKIAVSPDIMAAFETSLITQFNTNVAQAGVQTPNGSFRFRGYELVVVEGLGQNEMFMTSGENIALVFDSSADLNNLLIRNGLDDSTLCAEIKFRLDWRAGIFFGDGEKVVFYSPTNA